MVFGHMLKLKKRKENKDFLIRARPAARGASVLSMALHINYFSAHRLHMDKNWQFFFSVKSQVERHDVFKMSHCMYVLCRQSTTVCNLAAKTQRMSCYRNEISRES